MNRFTKKIARIVAYPAADQYGAAPGDILLASNESPFSPLQEVVAAGTKALTTVNRYPDPGCNELRLKLASLFQIDKSQIAVGNGSSELLFAVSESILDESGHLIYGWPSFSLYPRITQVTGAKESRVPLNGSHEFDLERFLDFISPSTRLIVICNPNNPTSTALPAEKIAKFVASVPQHVTVLIDEAYYEFNDLDEVNSSLQLLETFPNLVVLRTFSKLYGLAGLRVGYALCSSAELRAAIDQVRLPFVVNSVALAMAEEVLEHTAVFEQRKQEVLNVRRYLTESLQGLGFNVAQSHANFCWFELGELQEHEVTEHLLAQQIFVRSGTPLGCPNSIRVTCGTKGEVDNFLQAMAALS